MREKSILTAEPWLKLIPGGRSRVCVVELRPRKNPSGMEVTLQHLGPGQAGRRKFLILPLPLGDGTITTAFLEACGLDVTKGAQVDPYDLVGSIIFIRFRQAAQGDQHLPTTSESAANKETQNDNQPV